MSKSDDIKEGYRRGKSGASESTGWFDTPEDQKARDDAFKQGAIDRERELERERIARDTAFERDQKARDQEREQEERSREREEQREQRERELVEEQERIDEEAAERQSEILSEHREELRQLQEEREQAEEQRLDRYEYITKNAVTLKAMERLETGGQLQAAELFDEAIRMYGEAMQLSPAMVEPHWFMGQCLLALNRRDDAQTEIIKFLKLLALRRDEGIVQWWQLALKAVVTSFPADLALQGVFTKSLDLALPQFRASAIGLVRALREAGRPEAAATLLVNISKTARADFTSLQLVDKLRQAGGPDAASALLVRISKSAPQTLNSLTLLPILCQFNLKEDALELVSRIRTEIRAIPDQIVLAACEMNTYWALDRELVPAPATLCFGSIATANRLQAKSGLESLQKGKETAVLWTAEVYGTLVRILESRFVEWSEEIDGSLRQRSQAAALKAFNSSVEHPINRLEEAPKSVKLDAETRLSELWDKELQTWAPITTALRRPEPLALPDKPVNAVIPVTAGSGKLPGLIAMVIIGLMILSVIGVVVYEQLNGSERQVLSTRPEQVIPSAPPTPAPTAAPTPAPTVQPIESRLDGPATPVATKLAPSAVSFEAESAELSGSAKRNQEHVGYSGTGYVDGYGLDGLGATTTFRVTVAGPGLYAAVLRYANATGRAMTLTIYVNGVRVVRTAMPPLPDWNTWGYKTEEVELAQGQNTLAYRYDPGDTGSVNIDYVRIESASSGSVPQPTPALHLTESSSKTPPAVAGEATFTVIHRHGRGGLSGALVRQFLSGNSTTGPNRCRGDLVVSGAGFSFKTIETSDNRRDDGDVPYSDIKKVERKEPEHLRVETGHHGNWDFFAESSAVGDIERLLMARVNR